MRNSTIGTWLIASVGIAIFTAVMEYGMAPEMSDFLYGVAGVGMMVFGIWGGVRLNKVG